MASTTDKNSINSQFIAEPSEQLPLVRRNFFWMIIAAVLIIGGFLLMLGGSSTHESFNPDIFSVRRIVIGPSVSFIGYVLMGVAILLKPNTANKPTSDELA